MGASPCPAAALSALCGVPAVPHADVICRGVYPWEHGGRPPAADGPTSHELISKLRTHCNELHCAKEELALLAQERIRCQAYYQSQ